MFGMSQPTDYQKATTETASNLRTVAQAKPLRELSRLSLPEIDAVVDLTAKFSRRAMCRA
jgi:hypothetical protein